MFAAPLLLVLAYPVVTSAPSQTPTARDRERLLVPIISDPEDNLFHQLLRVTAPDGALRHIVRRTKENETIATPEQLKTSAMVLARTDGRDSVTLWLGVLVGVKSIDIEG